MEKWNTRLFFKNTAGSKAVTTHTDRKRNISRRLPLAIIFCIALIPLTNELNRANCGYQVHGTERKISHLLYMDGLKLIGRNEKDLEKELTIVREISKDIHMNFGLDKCARICLKGRRDQSKIYTRNIIENNIKELDPRKAYKYLA